MRLMRIMQEYKVKQRQARKPAIILAAAKKKWNILRGDKVQVIERDHSERGKQGIVLKVLRKLDRVIVEGVNLKPKHIKGDPERGIKPRTIMQERTLPYAAVNLVCPVTNLPTRVHRRILEDGTKVRISKKSGAIIPRPEILKMRKRPVSSIVTESDTSEEDAWAISFVPR
jgi:large subunit ribosomal protein L24